MVSALCGDARHTERHLFPRELLRPRHFDLGVPQTGDLDISRSRTWEEFANGVSTNRPPLYPLLNAYYGIFEFLWRGQSIKSMQN